MSTYEHEAMVGPPERTAEVLGSQGLTLNANERKRRGFYVDFADDGSLRLPSEVGASRCQTGRPGNGHAFRRAGASACARQQSWHVAVQPDVYGCTRQAGTVTDPSSPVAGPRAPSSAVTP
jgi:hypothetical protein